MEAREHPHIHKHKVIINGCNYDASCMLMPLPVREKF